MRYWQLQMIVISLSYFLVSSCSPKSSSDSLGQNGGATSSTTSDDCTGSASLLQSTGDGTIQFRLASNTDPCSVDGYVVGSSDTSGVSRNDDGSYVVTGVEEGEQDIILTGSSSGQTTSDESTVPNDVGGSNLQSLSIDTGIRVNGLSASGQIQNFRLAKFGKLSGRVLLNGATDHTGIDVYIPGTTYIAKTDMDGNYAIDNLPPGVHNLRFEFPQYASVVLPNLNVRSEETLQVPESRLYTGAGEGRILILDEELRPITDQTIIVKSRVVRFVLQVQGAPRLMKIAEDGNFANIAWQPFKSEGIYTFRALDQNAGGRETKRLSIRTLEGNTEGELEASVVVEMFSEIRGKEVLTVDNLDTDGETSLQIRIQTELASNIKEMRVATRSDFLGASWLEAQQVKFIPVDEEGDYPVFVQFRTNDLIMSDVYSAVAQVRIFPTGSVSFSVANPNKTISDQPTFSLVEVTSPRRTGDVKISFYADQDQDVLVEKDFGTSLTIDGLTRTKICGMKHLTAKFRYRKTIKGQTREFVSDAVVKNASYLCSEPVARIPGGRIDEANTGFGDGKIFTWSGTIAGTNSESSRGYIYDAETKTHEAIMTVNQPMPRLNAQVWFHNDKFIVFGGKSGSEGFYDGGIYDLETKTWQQIPEPTPRDLSDGCSTLSDKFEGSNYAHLVGDYILIWGNREYSDEYCDLDGYAFNLQTLSWQPMNIANLPRTPCNSDEELDYSAIALGTKLFVWGGLDCSDEDVVLSGGSIYDTETNTWTLIQTTNAPSDRFDYVRIWNGEKLLVWGGRTKVEVMEDGYPEIKNSYSNMQIGKLYNPSNNSWSTIASSPYSIHVGQKNASGYHAVAFNNKIGVFSGYRSGEKNWGGLIYEINNDSWRTMPTANQPAFKGTVKIFIDENSVYPFGENLDLSVQRGSKLVLWSRADFPASLTDDFIHGSVFDLNTEVWTALPTLDRSFKSLEANPYMRNYIHLGFISESDVAIYGGYKPYMTSIVPLTERALNEGAIIKIPAGN